MRAAIVFFAWCLHGVSLRTLCPPHQPPHAKHWGTARPAGLLPAGRLQCPVACCASVQCTTQNVEQFTPSPQVSSRCIGDMPTCQVICLLALHPAVLQQQPPAALQALAAYAQPTAGEARHPNEASNQAINQSRVLPVQGNCLHPARQARTLPHPLQQALNCCWAGEASTVTCWGLLASHTHTLTTHQETSELRYTSLKPHSPATWRAAPCTV